jgi:hypothetical protein
MVITVHNRYPDIELTLPVCFCNRERCYEYRAERMNNDTMIKFGLKFGLDQSVLEGILACEVRRKENVRSNHQSGINTSYAKIIEKPSRITLLLVSWRIIRFWKSNAKIILVEYDNKLVLNEDKLTQLYNKVINMHFGHSPSKWLMCDNTVLRVAYKVVYEKGPELNIYISQEYEDKDAIRSMRIDSTRQVLSEMVIYSILIYITSLTIQSVINITIDNQCSNIKLTSPVYFVQDATCRIQFPQHVNSKSIMKARFITGISRSTFGGALLYRLQEKKYTSTRTQLLVIWGYNSDKIYSHARLIEHESTLDWNKDKLKSLYNLYNIQYNVPSHLGRWWLSEDRTLKTKCETSHGGFEIKVIFPKEEEYYRTLQLPSDYLNR